MQIITGTTRCYPLVGYPVGQVRTPPAINAYFASRQIDAVMFPVEIKPDTIHHFLASLRGWTNCGGVSVTIPHKQSAHRAVDHLTVRARQAGAVNIIRQESDGTMFGDMTDGLAFVEALRRNGVSPIGKSILLVGVAGGAGTAIVQALCQAGAGATCLVDVNTGKLATIAEQLRAIFAECSVVVGWPERSPPIDIAINASPLGMLPDDPIPFALEQLQPSTVVADVVTKPNMTPLLVMARQRGHQIQTGNDMADAQLEFQMRHLGLWQPVE